MQITETSTDGLKRDYKVVIAAQDIDTKLQSRLVEVAKTITLPGFRPGKVPLKVLKQRYGGSVLGEVLEETVKSSSEDAIREQNLRPALQPKIEIESFGEGQDLVYALSVEVLPEIELPDLSKLVLERLKPEVADEELDEALKNLAERHRKTEPVEAGIGAESGDVLVIDFVGSVDGAEFPGGSAKDQDLEIGSGRFIPGFEEQLIGAKAGDHVQVKVTFPTEYGAAHLAGKDAVFEVDVTAVKRKQPAEIDDQLADQVGLENLDALRSAIRDQIGAEYGKVARQKLKRDLLDRLAEGHSFAVPQGMVEIEFESIWKEFEAERERAKTAGTYTETEGGDEASKAEYRGIAERRVRLGLLLAEIGRSNNIQVTQDEVSRAIMQEARQYPGQEKAVFDYFRNHPEASASLRAPLFEDKVVDFIVEAAAVTDKPVPAKDLLALAGMDEDGEEVKAA